MPRAAHCPGCDRRRYINGPVLSFEAIKPGARAVHAAKGSIRCLQRPLTLSAPCASVATFLGQTPWNPGENQLYNTGNPPRSTIGARSMRAAPPQQCIRFKVEVPREARMARSHERRRPTGLCQRF